MFAQGPYLSGQINHSSIDSDEVVSIIQYVFKEVPEDEYAISTLADELLAEFKEGEWLAGGMSMMNIQVNAEGFNLIAGLVSPFDYDLYLQALNATKTNEVLANETTVSFRSIVGNEASDLAESGTVLYNGAPNLDLYGGEGFFMVTNSNTFPLSLKFVWAVVPLLDLSSAAFTAFRWIDLGYVEFTPDNRAIPWYGVAGIQTILGLFGLVFWAGSFIFGDMVLVLYVLFHVIFELLLLPCIAFADYWASDPDTYPEATYWAYGVTTFNILLSIIVNGVYIIGFDINDLSTGL